MTRLMREEGVVERDQKPTDEEFRSFDKKRKNKNVGNDEPSPGVEPLTRALVTTRAARLGRFGYASANLPPRPPSTLLPIDAVILRSWRPPFREEAIALLFSASNLAKISGNGTRPTRQIGFTYKWLRNQRPVHDPRVSSYSQPLDSRAVGAPQC